MGPGMHKHVEVFIGRLATDPDLQRRFAERPIEVLLEQRLELTAIEVAALVGLDPQALRVLTAALDARLRKASRLADSRPAKHTTESENDSRKETRS
jgi:hypothetical protein